MLWNWLSFHLFILSEPRLTGVVHKMHVNVRQRTVFNYILRSKIGRRRLWTLTSRKQECSLLFIFHSNCKGSNLCLVQMNIYEGSSAIAWCFCRLAGTGVEGYEGKMKTLLAFTLLFWCLKAGRSASAWQRTKIDQRHHRILLSEAGSPRCIALSHTLTQCF